MAKKYSEVYEISKETAYGDVRNALVLAASLNSVISFSPIQKPNGIVGSTAQYNIQRLKRIKAKKVANATAKTTTADLAVLDSLQEPEWDSVGVATGELRSIGVKFMKGEEFDIDNVGSGIQKMITDSTNVEAITRGEDLLEEALKTTNVEVFTGTDYFTQLSDLADKIILKSDEFKHLTDRANMLMVIHPSIATAIAKEMGTAFTQEAPIYMTGVNSKFSVNGIPVLVDSNLNKFDGAKADGTDRIGAVVLDIEALAFKADEISEPIDQKLAFTRYYGTGFYSIQKLVDESRVIKVTFDATGKAAKTAKAND